MKSEGTTRLGLTQGTPVKYRSLFRCLLLFRIYTVCYSEFILSVIIQNLYCLLLFRIFTVCYYSEFILSVTIQNVYCRYYAEFMLSVTIQNLYCRYYSEFILLLLIVISYNWTLVFLAFS